MNESKPKIICRFCCKSVRQVPTITKKEFHIKCARTYLEFEQRRTTEKLWDAYMEEHNNNTKEII